MIRTIALASLAATTAFVGAAAPAMAGHIGGYEVTYLYDSGAFHTWDNMNVVGPNGLEYITVRCAPFNWESSGPNSAEWVDSIARQWCF